MIEQFRAGLPSIGLVRAYKKQIMLASGEPHVRKIIELAYRSELEGYLTEPQYRDIYEFARREVAHFV